MWQEHATREYHLPAVCGMLKDSLMGQKTLNQFYEHILDCYKHIIGMFGYLHGAD